MLMFGFHGMDFTSKSVVTFLQEIKNLQIGGTILFNYNIKSPAQLKNLTCRLKEAKKDLLIAVDQEGGKVQRLNSAKGFIETASAKAVAAELSLQQAFKKYARMAEMLQENGINMNLAPLVDVDNKKSCHVIGGMNRSFGEDEMLVTKYANEFIKAHSQYKILTTLKHFPGHGFATMDTHKGMVDVTQDAQPNIELQPYQRLLAKKYYTHHTAVMPAHIINRKMDQYGMPATFSKKIIDGLLRNKLRFDGVVITDALEMGAIQRHFTLEKTILNAILAGNDILLFARNKAASPHSHERDDWAVSPTKIIGIIEDAVYKRQITEKRIEQSFKRIAKARNFIAAND
jgi:beta-N-acetylhexosaminidase